MSTNRQPRATPVVAPADAPQFQSYRRVDQIDEPARPLGEKRAALHTRRQRTAGAAGGTISPQAASAGTRVIATKDAGVAFVIRRTSAGLVIERTQRQPVGACLVQTMSFQDARWFDRWCESEPVRFEEPVLYDQLRREGHEALGGKW
ncbi:MAG: hypothetical protein JF607_23855 [Burkholderiales bacterium]|jgi:hypothetical protein|nr:hypothetical protein [Burkholderiales bacterium]